MRVPIIEWSRQYRRSWLRTDVIAGLTVVALLVPEGMAYAQIAGVPPEAAFYAAPIGLLMFAIFGSSKQLIVAVSSAIASMSFGAVSAIAEPNTAEFITLTAALALLAGVFSVLAGLLKLGRVAQFFSESVMVGFITGLALLIMVKQVPKLLGIEGGDGNFWERTVDVFRNLDETDWLTFAVGAGAIVLMLIIERFAERIPAALVALVTGIVLSSALDFEGRRVEIVGELPSGLAAPQWPDLTAQQWWLLVPGAAGIALVAFAEAIGPARAFADEHGDKLDPDQELVGIGFANAGAGLFRGFPIGSSLSKSAANNRAGAHSQFSAIVAAGLTALVALFFTDFFRTLPEAVLGAIVVVAVSGMVKLTALRHLARVRRVDFWLAIASLIAVLTVETLPALAISVAISAFILLWRTSRPRLGVLGFVPDHLEVSDIGRHPENTSVPGLVVVRPDNELFFANVTGFKEAIDTAIEQATPPVEAVLFDLGASTELDVPAMEMLETLGEHLHARGVRLMLVHVIAEVKSALRTSDVLPHVTDADIFRGYLPAILDHLRARQDHASIEELRRVAEGAVSRIIEHRPSAD